MNQAQDLIAFFVTTQGPTKDQSSPGITPIRSQGLLQDPVIRFSAHSLATPPGRTFCEAAS